MTKDELLGRMREDRSRLDAAVDRVAARGRTEPAFGGGWSINDILAHVSFWERTCTGWLVAVAEGRAPARPEVRDVDATNARAHAEARGRTPEAIARDAREAFAAIIDATASLSDADIADEARFGFPVWGMIDGNSAEHYREHAEQIEAWLAAGTT